MIKICIGITIFILIFSSFYHITYSEQNSNSNRQIEELQKSENIVFYGKFPLPVENFITLTSMFGNRKNPFNANAGSENHSGLDIVGAKGSNVIAICDGKITFSGVQGGYGYCVEIEHKDDEGKVFYSFYGHMRAGSINVSIGQIVTQGTIIGIQGSTGRSTGDHVHLEIRLANKKKVDPYPFVF